MNLLELCVNTKQFLTNLQLNLYDEDDALDLMDLFPLAKKGIISSQTIQRLLTLYAVFQGLIVGQNITINEPLRKCMRMGACKTINILHFNAFMGMIFDTSSTKIGTETDIYTGLVKENWISGCICSMTKLLEASNFNLYRFIRLMKSTIHHQKKKNKANAVLDCTINILTNHPRINKLYVSISSGDMESVSNQLNCTSSINNRFKAYKLAASAGNTIITNLVRNNIIYRLLFYKELLANFLGITDIYLLIVDMF
jgi:hypothetical protein